MTASGVPMAVLSQQLAEKIDGRRVSVALFTTFTFDPGFFELHVLPLLFDQSFSQVDKVRRIQLEDALRDMRHLSVYYDRSALAQEAEPASLPYERNDVRRNTGVFHPKVILLLVDEPKDSEAARADQSLIVAIQSANLTRQGWWENVECAHIEEIPSRFRADKPTSFRSDLLKLFIAIERSSSEDDTHHALNEIRRFLRRKVWTDPITQATSRGRYHTRIFSGAERLSFHEWLDAAWLSKPKWNLEVISPFFDHTGAGPLSDLLSSIPIHEARVYLPQESDGEALVTSATYDAIKDLGAHWGVLEGSVTQRSGGANRGTLPRRVHAKVYRFWRKGEREVIITGSVNLTRAAHSRSNTGNLEAAFLVDTTGKQKPQRWWLKRLDHEVESFVAQVPDENEGVEVAPVDVSVRYDWAAGELSYRLAGKPDPFTIGYPSGAAIVEVTAPTPRVWVPLAAGAAEKVGELLRSTSFLEIQHTKGRWRVLVREENMAYRPSLLAELTPEEILQYWALLTAEQRAFFIERHVGREVALEGISLERHDKLVDTDSLFARFAGIFHAFGALERHIESALMANNPRDAEMRLCGAKYDSLPSLLDKTLTAASWDPVVRYVTFLCAHRLTDTVEQRFPEFYHALGEKRARLQQCLNQLRNVRESLPKSEMGQADEFLEWYDMAFLGRLPELEPD